MYLHRIGGSEFRKGKATMPFAEVTGLSAIAIFLDACSGCYDVTFRAEP